MEGTSIGEVLESAKSHYGAAFTEQARTCRVWVNGEEPTPDVRLSPEDEVALLPPVSGG